MFKKILAIMIAVLITISIMFKAAFKVDAVAAPASVLSYLLQACVQVLIGSGQYTQDQINDMSASDILDTANQTIPNIDFPVPDLGYYLTKFICENPETQLPAMMFRDLAILPWIASHSDSVSSEVDSSILNGYGACIRYDKHIADYSSSSLASLVIGYEYCDYVVLNYNVDAGKAPIMYLYGKNNIHTYLDGHQEFFGDLSTSFNPSQVSFFGDVRYLDGTAADDIVSDLPTVTPAIGEVIIDGKPYPVNPDGTVTIGDSIYYINPDGSVTYEGDKYYPTYNFDVYDDSALLDLLSQILAKISVTEDSETDDLLDELEVEVPIEIANSELSSLTLPKTIATVFPFCIPWDFYNGIKLLSQDPEAPRFEVPFEIPEYKSFPGFKKMIVIDFSEYTSAFAVVRWTMFTIFIFGLCFITFRIVKGA